MAVLSLFAYLVPQLPWVRRFSLPDVAILLLLGVVTNAINPHIHTLALFATHRSWLTIAASLLIFYGGAELTKETMRAIWKPVIGLATFGVGISIVILGLLLALLSVAHLPLITDLLIGAILAGTDPTVLISLLDVIALRDRMKEMLIAESALNDPVSALVATSLITLLKPAGTSLRMQILITVWEILSAIGAGALLGIVITRLPQRSLWRYRTVRMVSVFTLASILSFFLQSSPFLMAFITGFLAHPLQDTHSDSKIIQSETALRFRLYDHKAFDILLFVVRSYLFLALGLSFPLHASMQDVAFALITAILLITVARPLSVFSVKGVFHRVFPLREAVFCACNRQTGVIPALFANELLHMHVAHAAYIDLVITFTILVTSVLLLPIFQPLAHALNLIEKKDDFV